MASRSDIEAGAAYVRLYVKNSELLQGLSRLKLSLKEIGDMFTAWGRQLTKLSLVMALPFVAGAKAAADFDQQMRMISTMLDDDSHMAKFAAGIKSMAAEFGESTDTLAKGLYDLLGSAVAPADALNVLREAVKAAKGGMTDTATATAAMVNVLNAYHIPASRAAEVSDLLFMTAKNGVVTFEQLAQYIGSVTATGYAAGLSMDEMGASIATMTRNGLNADSAVTALQNILSEFLKPSVEGAAAARSLGIELNTVTLRSKGLVGVLEQLKKATPEQLAKIFPDVRGLRGVLALRGDFDGLAKDLEAMQAKAGATESAFKKMSGSMWTMFHRLREELMNIARAAGSALEKPFTEFTNTMTPVLKQITSLIEKNQSLVRTSAAVVIGVFATGSGLLALGAAFKIAAFATGQLRFLLMPATMALGAMNFAVKSVRASLSSMAATMAKAGRDSATHIGTMLRGIGQVAVGVGQIGASAGQSLASGIGRGARAAGPVVLQAVRAMGSGLMSVASFHAQQISEAFAPLGSMIAAKLAPIGAMIGKHLRGPFLEAYLAASIVATKLAPVWNRITTIGSAAAARVTAAWRVAAPAIANALTTSITATFNRVRAVGMATAGALGRGMGNIGRGVGGIAMGASGLIGMFGSSAGGALGSIAMAVPMVLMLATSFTSLLNPAALLTAALMGGVYAWATYTESGKKALESLRVMFQPVIDIGWQAAEGIRNAFAKGDIALAGRIAVTALKVVFLMGLTEITKSFGGIFGPAFSGLLSAWNVIVKAMGDFWNKWGSSIVSTFQDVTNKISKMWRSAITGMADYMLELSASGGALGAAASHFLGVDMDKQQATAERVRLGGIKVQRELIEEDKRNIERAQANGGTVAVGAETFTVADLENLIKQREQRLKELKYEVPNVLADAKADVQRQQDYAESPEAAAERAASLAKATEEARNLLNALTSDAMMPADLGEAYWGLYGGDGPAGVRKEDIVAPDIAAMRGNAAAVSFTAAGLIAQGGGSPQERIAKAAEENVKHQKTMLAKMERQINLIEKLALRGVA